MDYNPLRFMWIAEFDNGDCISQFNPDTGKETSWKNINIKRIIKLSWVTISSELSEKILLTEGIFTNPSIIPEKYTIEYKNGEKPLIYRRNYIEFSNSVIVDRRTKYILGKNEEIIYEVE